MRKQIHPAIILSLFGIFIAILLLNRPSFEDHPIKTKPNALQVETQALHNVDRRLLDHHD